MLGLHISIEPFIRAGDGRLQIVLENTGEAQIDLGWRQQTRSISAF